MQEKTGFNSVRTRLIFWFLVVSISPLIIVSAFILYWEVQSIRSEAFRKLIAVRDLKVNEINHWIDERLGDIRTIADLPEIRGLVDTTSGGYVQHEKSQKVREALVRYVNNFIDYDELFLINAHTGKVELSTNRSSEGLDKSKLPYFTEPIRKGDVFIQDIYYSRAIDRPSMTFSIPIFALDPPDSMTWVLVARIDLDHSLYIPLLDLAGMGNTGESLIVNRDAIALNELRWYSSAPLRLRIDAEPAQRASRGEKGITETADYRGVRVLAAYTHIPRTGWGLVSKQDLKEVYAPISSMVRDVLIILFIAALGVYALAFSVAKRLSSPVIRMINISRRIAEGELSARNQTEGPGEYGYLARSFNDMADSLMSRIEIQKGIREITDRMVASGEIKEFCRGLLTKIMEKTGSNMGALYMLNREERRFEPFASDGVSRELLDPFDVDILEGEFGAALRTKKISRIMDIPEGTLFKFKSFTGTMLPKEIITIPILVKERVMAVVSLASLEAYRDEAFEILERCWMALNTGFSNILANEETREMAGVLDLKNKELEALTQELRHQSDELHAQNLELERQRTQLEDASRVKNEFFSKMSHELRTPLNSIMTLSRVLLTRSREMFSGEEEMGYLEIIERNGKQLLKLINDILDLSKLEAGGVEIRPRPFSIRSAIEIVVENLSPVAEEKGIQIISEISQELPIMESDEATVNQIFQNILGNAVKFTEQGNITVVADSDDRRVRVIIKDSGIGIAKEDLPHIFDEFRQVGNSALGHEGTGLGLAIAYRAAKMLGGDIVVESTLGKGSTFTVTLPTNLSKEKIKHLSKTEDLVQFQEGPEGERNKRVLLVEDNEIAILQMKRLLEKEGYLVDVTHNGQEALDYLRDKIPDGVILDLMMPEVDGFEVLDRIKGARETAAIPVIVLTAMDLSDKELKRLRSNNIQQLIQKGDVNREDLLNRVRSMLGGRQGPGNEMELSPGLRKGVRRSGMKKEEPNSAGNVKRPVVLVIEDNPDNLTTIRAILKDDYEMMEADDGEKGLESAISRLPDLILLDISLPKMDGFAVIRGIREDDRAGTIPVIALTAHAMMGDRDNIINAGCDDYVSKPIDPVLLRDKIRKWL